jgi:hypothetical protein
VVTLVTGYGNSGICSRVTFAPSGQKGLTPENVRTGVRDSSYTNKRRTMSLIITNKD